MQNKQHYWQSPFVNWTSTINPNWLLFIFYINPSRQKARVSAIVEVLSILRDLKVDVPIGGPLAEQKGVFWISLEKEFVPIMVNRLPWLGYTAGVDLLEPIIENGEPELEHVAQIKTIKWRGSLYKLKPIFREDKKLILERSPDKRLFLFENYKGDVNLIKGYRGGNDKLTHRALPVADAKLLVNLVFDKEASKLLDPFAGAGGVIIESRNVGHYTVSVDQDLSLRHGLAVISDAHIVANSSYLPFKKGSFNAVATEPPYDKSTKSVLIKTFKEIARVVKKGGRISILSAEWQADILRKEAEKYQMKTYLDEEINRKGTDVHIFAWIR